MHDRPHTYCILYDEGDPDFDPKDKFVRRCGDHLLMATWEQIERDKPAGLISPVLVREFTSPCWELAMQSWNDLRGFSPYWTTCLSPTHDGDTSVKWRGDDGLCASCLIEDKLTKAVNFSVQSGSKAQLEAAKANLTHEIKSLKESQFVDSYTVSSSKVTDGANLTVWVRTRMGEQVRKSIRVAYR